MSGTATVNVVPADAGNRVSWGAVFAGVVMTLAAQLVLSLLGFGLAAAGIAHAVTRMSPGTFLFFIGLWWALSGIAAASIGGFTAGRMAGAQPATAAGWHGLVSWGVSVMVVAFLLISGSNMIADDIYQTAGYRGLNGVSYEQEGRINGSSLTEGPAVPAAPSAIPNPGIPIDQVPVQTPQYSLRVSPPPVAVPDRAGERRPAQRSGAHDGRAGRMVRRPRQRKEKRSAHSCLKGFGIYDDFRVARISRPMK